MEEDKVLAKITRLLERGCTMLASHHDCGAPLFRCQGDIVCPVCSFEDESISAMREPASEAVSGEEERRSDLSRAQLLQMHETPSRRGIKKDRSDRSAERVEPDRSPERGQSDRSADMVESDRSPERGQPDRSADMVESDRSPERDQPDRSADMVESDRSPERDQPDRSADMVESDRSPERGQPDRSREGYQSIQDEVQFHSVENDLRSALLFRLHELTASLRAEQDLDKLKRLLDCLEALLRVLKSLPE